MAERRKYVPRHWDGFSNLLGSQGGFTGRRIMRGEIPGDWRSMLHTMASTYGGRGMADSLMQRINQAQGYINEGNRFNQPLSELTNSLSNYVRGDGSSDEPAINDGRKWLGDKIKEWGDYFQMPKPQLTPQQQAAQQQQQQQMGPATPPPPPNIDNLSPRQRAALAWDDSDEGARKRHEEFTNSVWGKYYNPRGGGNMDYEQNPIHLTQAYRQIGPDGKPVMVSRPAGLDERGNPKPPILMPQTLMGNALLPSGEEMQLSGDGRRTLANAQFLRPPTPEELDKNPNAGNTPGNLVPMSRRQLDYYDKTQGGRGYDHNKANGPGLNFGQSMDYYRSIQPTPADVPAPAPIAPPAPVPETRRQYDLNQPYKVPVPGTTPVTYNTVQGNVGESTFTTPMVPPTTVMPAPTQRTERIDTDAKGNPLYTYYSNYSQAPRTTATYTTGYNAQNKPVTATTNIGQQQNYPSHPGVTGYTSAGYMGGTSNYHQSQQPYGPFMSDRHYDDEGNYSYAGKAPAFSAPRQQGDNSQQAPPPPGGGGGNQNYSAPVFSTYHPLAYGGEVQRYGYGGYVAGGGLGAGGVVLGANALDQYKKGNEKTAMGLGIGALGSEAVGAGLALRQWLKNRAAATLPVTPSGAADPETLAKLYMYREKEGGRPMLASEKGLRGIASGLRGDKENQGGWPRTIYGEPVYNALVDEEFSPGKYPDIFKEATENEYLEALNQYHQGGATPSKAYGGAVHRYSYGGYAPSYAMGGLSNAITQQMAMSEAQRMQQVNQQMAQQAGQQPGQTPQQSYYDRAMFESSNSSQAQAQDPNAQAQAQAQAQGVTLPSGVYDPTGLMNTQGAMTTGMAGGGADAMSQINPAIKSRVPYYHEMYRKIAQKALAPKGATKRILGPKRTRV